MISLNFVSMIAFLNNKHDNTLKLYN